MNGEIKQEAAFAGRRVKQKVVVALALCSVIPLLVLAYVFHDQLVSGLDVAKGMSNTLATPIIVVFTSLLVAAGGYVIWDLASAVSRVARLVSEAQPAGEAAGARHDEIGTLMVSFNRMTVTIEQQTREIRQLNKQAFRDSLTGLPNRTLFMDRLGHGLIRARKRNEHVAVLFLDLDRFKVINDTLGHAVGDELLLEVGRRLAAALRPGDTVARLGGDEFGLLLENVADAETATALTERIETELAKPLDFEGREIFITASIGIALSSAHHGMPEEILRDADLAMYQAKAKGKACHELFDDSVSTPAVGRMHLEMDLRAAISRREFRLAYQPILRLDTGRITEVEALIRWQHEKHGLLKPAAFIDLAEETGLIVSIGQWVLTEACRQLRAWHLKFPSIPPLVMSVNLSAKQLQHAMLVQEVRQGFEESGIDAASLKLEITESVVMQDVPATVDKFKALKDLGIRLAIDDFGTGYSSLGYLKRFPVDTLKIDQSFVKGLSTDSTDTAIVRAIVTVAKTLNMDVTAEGIETEQQRIELKAIGCDRGQGFLFARPAGAEHVTRLLATSWGGAVIAA